MPFEVEPLNFATLAPGDRQLILAFAKQTGELQRAVLGTLEALNEGLTQVTNIKRIIERTPSLSLSLAPGRPQARAKLMDMRERFTGDPTKARRFEPALPGCSTASKRSSAGTGRRRRRRPARIARTTRSRRPNSKRPWRAFARSWSAICPRCTRRSKPPGPPGHRPQAADLETVSDTNPFHQPLTGFASGLYDSSIALDSARTEPTCSSQTRK